MEKSNRIGRFIVTRLPALCLALFGLVHLYHAQTDRLSARVGGGFGMYAVAERHYIRTFAVSDTHEIMFDSERYLAQEVSSVIFWPSETRLAAFTENLVCNIFFKEDFPKANEVKLEYWYGHFSHGAMNLAKRETYEARCTN